MVERAKKRPFIFILLSLAFVGSLLLYIIWGYPEATRHAEELAQMMSDIEATGGHMLAHPSRYYISYAIPS